jgi:hypothetical protein
MPTGYTAKLMEHGETFPEFAMRCARAFGACIDMRDDSMDAPIPEKFEPSNYNAERLAESESTLANLLSIDDECKLQYGIGRRMKAVAIQQEILNSHTAENARLDKMIAEVESWTPPTKDHQGLWKFMLEQLAMSKHDLSYVRENLKSYGEKTPMQYYKEAVKSAKSDIEYHKKEQRKEEKRTNGRNKWVRQLRESLK